MLAVSLLLDLFARFMVLFLHDIFRPQLEKVCYGLNIAETRVESRGPCTHLRLFTGDFIKMTLSDARS